jgi:large subunit ribosomal protein L23
MSEKQLYPKANFPSYNFPSDSQVECMKMPSMIREERLLQVLHALHVSEKASIAMEKNNTLVIKVAKDATKAEIKAAVNKLFKVKVNDVQTLVVKGKTRLNRRYLCHRSDWKKAYVTLKAGQSLECIGGEEE